MSDVQAQIRWLREGVAGGHALEIADSLERLSVEIRQYKEAYKIAYEATYQSHTGHWDKQGTHGANCPECNRARDARKECDDILAASDTQTEIKRRALWYECVRLYEGQGMRLGEAQIRADLVMDRAIAAATKQEKDDG